MKISWPKGYDSIFRQHVLRRRAYAKIYARRAKLFRVIRQLKRNVKKELQS